MVRELAVDAAEARPEESAQTHNEDSRQKHWREIFHAPNP
jgi:hypothetical protein